MCYMRVFNWNKDKGKELKEKKGIGFKEAAYLIENGGVLRVIDNPNQAKYSGQKMFIIKDRDYAWLVPFVEDDKQIFLKTIIPSRKATKKYLKGGKSNEH